MILSLFGCGLAAGLDHDSRITRIKSDDGKTALYNEFHARVCSEMERNKLLTRPDRLNPVEPNSGAIRITSTKLKRLIFFVTMAGATGGAIAFSLITGNEFTPKPPPRSLPEAYAIALKALASATNDYYCVDAKRSHDWCRAGGGEWVFTFDKNDMQHKLVFVAMKPYASVNPDSGFTPWPLTEVRDTGVILNSTNAVRTK
jgi:hypothetical protein